MQPFEYVILLFLICLIHGIYRAIQDIRRETARDFCDSLMDKLSKVSSSGYIMIHIPNKEIFINSPGGMVRDGKELHAYLSKDCVS